MNTVGVETRRLIRATGRRRLGRIPLRLPRFGGLGAILRWAVLIEFVYVFLFPVIFMFTTSIKTLSEINNPSVRWISLNPTMYGYRTAIPIMGYWDGLRISGLSSIAATIGQTLVGAMVAYGFARIRFPGRDVIFGFLLFTVVVPLPTIMVPQFMLYTKLKWTNTVIPLIVPAFMGWGVRGGILLIVYRQFFRGLPYELEDAAKVDGAGVFRTFWQIMLPLARPAILVVLVFSLTWTYNDNYVPWLVIKTGELMTLGQRLETFFSLLNRHGGIGGVRLEPNVYMAATVMTILPLIVMYVFAQRQFTQSVDRTGLVE